MARLHSSSHFFARLFSVFLFFACFDVAPIWLCVLFASPTWISEFPIFFSPLSWFSRWNAFSSSWWGRFDYNLYMVAAWKIQKLCKFISYENLFNSISHICVRTCGSIIKDKMREKAKRAGKKQKNEPRKKIDRRRKWQWLVRVEVKRKLGSRLWNVYLLSAIYTFFRKTTDRKNEVRLIDTKKSSYSMMLCVPSFFLPL